MDFAIQRKTERVAPPTLDYWDDYEGMKVSLSERFDELIDLSTSCQDYPRLAKQDYHYLFVYDGKKQGFKRHKELLGYPCVGVGYTKAHFTMYNEVTSSGNYQSPIILMGGVSSERAPIYGEIYKVHPEKIAELDWYESCGPVCQRIKTPIEAIVDKSGTEKQLYCYFYIHKFHYWQSRMDRLKPVQPLVSNKGGLKYYNFLKKFEQVFQ